MIFFDSLFDLENKYKQFLNTDEIVEIECWIKNNRSSKKVGFLDITDGTARNLQVVYKSNNLNNFVDLSKLSIWSAIRVEGRLVYREDINFFEIEATKIDILANSNSDFALQNKEHSYEFLREISHLRPRSNLFNAVMKIRSEAAFAIHNFYHSMNFIYLMAPEITENDGEGAGENFLIKTRSKESFFGSEAYLSVSGQLHAEAYAQAFKYVYTFGPTFRAENSHTNRHISEFWMIEPEVAFKDQKFGIQLAEKNIKYVIKHILENCQTQLEICSKKTDINLINKLKKYYESDFPIIEYKDAINLLNKAVKEGIVFENNKIEFGMDLNSEHEKYICEKIYDLPTFIINYPYEIKAFYMKLNNDKTTVAAYDCLVPGIGEIVGGSERESDIEIIRNRCRELNIDTSKLEWYLDLRKYGYYKSVGFGIGFERLVMMLTGIDNIRDVIPFPRFPGSLKF